MLNDKNEKVMKLFDWSRGKNPGPFSIEIHPTSICNLKCIMCGAKYNSKKELPKIKLNYIIYEAADLGVKRISISGGGEPLLYEQGIVEIMKTVKLLRLEGVLTTNGTLFQQNQIKKIVNIGWDEVIFSLDAPDDKTHDYIRGINGTFKKCIESIKLFGYWKKKLNRSNPKIKINTVITNKNYNKLGKIIRLARELECYGILFQVLIRTIDDAKKLELNKSEKIEFQILIKKVKLCAQKLHVKTNINDFIANPLIKKSSNLYEFLLIGGKNPRKKELFSAPCFEPWISMIIPPEGRIGPCPRIAEKSPIDIKNSTLKEIWYGKFFDKIRRDILNRKLSNHCKKCCSPKIADNINIKKIISK